MNTLRILIAAVLLCATPARGALDYTSGWFSGTTTALSGTSALTVLVRLKADTMSGGTSDLRYITSIESTTEGTAVFYLRIATNTGQLRFSTAGTSYTGVTGSTVLSTGTVYSVAAVYGSSNVTLYLDGVSIGTAAANATTGSYNTLGIGTDLRSTARDWDGTIEELALYNAALTTAEIAAYHNGLSPLNIRPQSLVFYQPAVRNEQPVKGPALTKTGTVTAAPHSRTYR